MKIELDLTDKTGGLKCQWGDGLGFLCLAADIPVVWGLRCFPLGFKFKQELVTGCLSTERLSQEGDVN